MFSSIEWFIYIYTYFLLIYNLNYFPISRSNLPILYCIRVLSNLYIYILIARFEFTIPIRRSNIFDFPTPETGWSLVFAQFPLPPSQSTIPGYGLHNLGCNPSVFAADTIDLGFDRPGFSFHCDAVKGCRPFICGFVARFNELCDTGSK